MFKKILSFVFFLIAIHANAQYWQKTNAATAAVGADTRLLSATVGDTIIALARNTTYTNILTVSTDLGQTWSTGSPVFTNLIDGVIPTISELEGVGSRLYVRITLGSSYYNLYYYSDDLGANWTVDTAGLPDSFNPAFKYGFRLVKMSDNYMALVSEFDGAYFKAIGESTWRYSNTFATVSQKNVQDITYVGSTWYALNNYAANPAADRITKSTDFGQSWSSVSYTGLPTGFAPYNLVSNHVDKFYMSGSIAGADANSILYSNDGCATWTATNTASLASYSLASVYLRDLFAIEDYVFTTFYPEGGDTVSKIFISNSPSPNFSLCSVDGLPIYAANIFALGPPILSYFNVGSKLFIAYADDIYSSSPGFTGNNAGIGLEDATDFFGAQIFPNPAKDNLNIKVQEATDFKVFSIQGALMAEGKLDAGLNSLDLNLPQGSYLIQIGQEIQKLMISANN